MNIGYTASNTNLMGELLRLLPIHVFWKNVDGVYLGCNDCFAKGLGLHSAQEIIGKTDYDLPVEKELSDLYRQDDILVMNSKNAKLNIEEEQTFSDGHHGFLLTNKVPLFDDLGNVMGILGVYIDITEKKKTELALIESKELAEVASRTKTEFLANMSHDVKTPISGIIGAADLMMHSPNACTPEKAKIIHASGLQVLNFFNRCLELSKLETTEWESKEETFSLKGLLEDLHALFLPQAQIKGLNFNLEYAQNLNEMFVGQRASIYRVILNLIGNALKFTETGGIRVRAFFIEKISEKESLIGIEVQDTGVGIPENKQEIIFEKLRRLTPSYEGKVEGNGIGLYIVDQYVKHMKGEINVDSSPGKGSAFKIILPIKVPSSIKTTHSHNSKKSDKFYIEKNPLILLVEDNPIVQMVTKNLLSDIGFEVDVASTGNEAVDAFMPGKYGLVFMDIGLPDIDGYAVTKAIREKERAADTKMTPVIALTGHAALDVQSICKDVGMQGVISKPIQRHQIENLWKRYGQGKSVQVDGLILV